jgi:hypothetical protein
MHGPVHGDLHGGVRYRVHFGLRECGSGVLLCHFVGQTLNAAVHARDWELIDKLLDQGAPVNMPLDGVSLIAPVLPVITVVCCNPLGVPGSAPTCCQGRGPCTCFACPDILSSSPPCRCCRGQGHTLLTISAFTGQWCKNREGDRVLAIQMLLDRPQGQPAPAADVYVAGESRSCCAMAVPAK